MSSILPDDAHYFVRRAEQQLEMAQAAENEQVVSAHYQLANLYLDRAYQQVGPWEPAEVASAA